MTVLVVMGVSGSGKTTIADLLARRLGWQFQEGDALHPKTNIEKMASGTPLIDAVRWPWRRTISALIDAWRAKGQNGIVTCSALKRAYRDILLGNRSDVRLIYLQADKSLLVERLANRHGHFMPASLLDSQLSTLEAPGADERPIVANVGGSPTAIVNEIMRQMD